MADLIALGPYGLGDRPQRHSLRSQALHFSDRLLLAVVGDELVALATREAERHSPTEEAAAGLLVGLRLADALADAIALGPANSPQLSSAP